MPGETAAARRYARAVFDLASERGDAERWQQDLGAIAALMSDPGADAVFANSKVAQSDKFALVERALQGIDPLSLNLARLLVRKHRTALASDIANAFGELYDEAQGIAHATVRTAVELGDAERQAVVKRLSEMTGKTVVIDTEVDASIIGGMIVRIGDRLIDGSTRTRLVQLRRRLQEAAG